MALDLLGARTIAEAALAEAASRGLRVSCSVVDERGNELITLRMDGASWFTAGVARTKARTCAVMGRASGQLAGLRTEYPELVTLISGQLPFEITTLPGGVPIVREGMSVGGIGISGAHPDEDVACAEAGVAGWLAP